MKKTKRGIPDDQKKAEGKRLKLIWETKVKPLGVTQDAFYKK